METAVNVDSIALTNYQISFFSALKDRDGNVDSFEASDLKNLTQESLKSSMDSIYAENGIYNVKDVNVHKRKVSLDLEDSDSSKKHIDIEFEKKPNWFQRTCKSVGKFFSNLWNTIKGWFSSSKKEPTIEEKKTNYIEEKIYTAQGEEKGYVLCNDFGVSYYRLKAANPDVNFYYPLNAGDVIKIPYTEKVKPGAVHNFEEVAEAAGVSPEFINDIMFGIEGKDKNPVLKADYDRVPDETHPKGYLTIGFGHIGRVHGKPLEEGVTITEEEAYELLTNDIIDARLDAIEYFGESFLKAPQSIQDGIIDLIFNKDISKAFIENPNVSKGTDTPSYHLKEDVEKGDYISAISHLEYYTPSRGLQKRNLYRMIYACKDLSESDQKEAMQSIKNYCSNVIKKYEDKPSEQSIIQNAFDNAYKNNIYCNFFN